MDTLIGIKGKDFVIIAADNVNAYSVLKMKQFDDKIWNLDGEKLMAVGGEHSDVLVFADYIQKNLAFFEYKNGVKLSIEDTANFVRHELAEAIRKGPYQANCLLAGFEGDEPKLYWLDYLGSIIETSKAAHGYAEFFTSTVMDTLETKVISEIEKIVEDMTEEQAMAIIERCLNSMRDRCIITQTQFTIKVIRKNGIEVIRKPVIPQGA